MMLNDCNYSDIVMVRHAIVLQIANNNGRSNNYNYNYTIPVYIIAVRLAGILILTFTRRFGTTPHSISTRSHASPFIKAL